MKNLVIKKLTDFERENITATETKGLINTCNCDGKNVPRETVKERDE